MKKCFLLISSSLLLVISILQAQDPVGHYFDINGEYIYGSIDPFSYQPNQFLNFTHNSEGFEKGVYYDNEGTPQKGWVKFDARFIKYKKSSTGVVSKLLAKNVKAVCIGIDSFFVANNFQVLREVGLTTVNKANFFQYLGETEGYVFAKHYLFTSGAGQFYLNASPVYVTYQYLKKGAVVWKPIVRDGNKYEKFCENVFGDVNPIMAKVGQGMLGINQLMKRKDEKVDNGIVPRARKGATVKSIQGNVVKDVTNEDIYSQIRIALRWDKFNRNEFIHFDQFWNEKFESDRTAFYAKINSIEDTIWSLSYFNDTRKLYDVQFSHFYPDRKNGKFVSYYATGDTMKVIDYKNDISIYEKYFYENGQLNLEIERGKDEEGLTRRIIHHNDSLGDSYLEEMNDSKIVTVFAPVTIDEIEFEYEERAWKQVSIRRPGMDVVLQHVSLNTDVNIRRLQGVLMGFNLDVNFDSSVEKDVQGTVLIRIRIDEKGKVLEAERLNGIFNQVDERLDAFLTKYMRPEYRVRLKFKPYKIGNVKTAIEFVIPIVFNVNRFYRNPSNYYNSHFMFQHQMMMNQMNSITAPPPITPPTFSAPRF